MRKSYAEENRSWIVAHASTIETSYLSSSVDCGPSLYPKPEISSNSAHCPFAPFARYGHNIYILLETLLKAKDLTALYTYILNICCQGQKSGASVASAQDATIEGLAWPPQASQHNNIGDEEFKPQIGSSNTFMTQVAISVRSPFANGIASMEGTASATARDSRDKSTDKDETDDDDYGDSNYDSEDFEEDEEEGFQKGASSAPPKSKQTMNFSSMGLGNNIAEEAAVLQCQLLCEDILPDAEFEERLL